jgi:hypothetical protein
VEAATRLAAEGHEVDLIGFAALPHRSGVAGAMDAVADKRSVRALLTICEQHTRTAPLRRKDVGLLLVELAQSFLLAPRRKDAPTNTDQ